MKNKTTKSAIVIFFVVFSFGLLWALVTPGNTEAPDESSHVNMVRYLKENKKIPVFNDPNEKEIVQTVYDQRIASGAYYSMAYNSPLNYLPFTSLSFSKSGVEKSTVFPMRLVSVLFVGLFAVFLYFGLIKFFPDNPREVFFSSLFVLMIPQVISTAGYVNVEPFSLMVSAIAFYFLSRILFEKKEALTSYIFLGLALGAMALTKVNYYLLFLFFGLIILRDFMLAKDRRKKAKNYLVSVTLALIIPAWWWARNLVLYGDPLIMTYIKNEILGKAPSWLETPADHGYTFLTIFGNRDFFDRGILGFFASLGGATIKMAGFYYLAFFLILSALIILAVLRGSKKYRPFILFSGLTIIVSLLMFASKNLYDFSPQGRHLFPIILPLSFLVSLGVSAISSEKIRKLASAVALVFIFFSVYSGLYYLLKGYYLTGSAYAIPYSGPTLAGFSFWPIDLSAYYRLINFINFNSIWANYWTIFAFVLSLASLFLVFKQVLFQDKKRLE